MTTPHELACVRTHVVPLDLFSALGDEVWKVIGEQPKRESVLCLVCQWAVESGGGQSCYNWNLTNIRHTANDGRDWCVIPSCSEILTDEHGVKHEVHYTAAANPEKCMFRAFETIAGGVADYVATLQRKFPDAWAAMLTGDPDAFAKALSKDRFYTASVSGYEAALLHWWHTLDKSLPTS